MKILLDENIPLKAKFDLGEPFEVRTVKDMGWLGFSDKELLRSAASENFAVFITLDKKMRFQQNFSNYDLKILVLRATDNKHQTVKLLMDKARTILQSASVPAYAEIS